MKYKYLSKLLAFVFIATGIAGEGKIGEDTSIENQCTYQAESLFITHKGEVNDSIVKLLGLTGIRVLNDSLEAGNEWPEARVYLKSRALEEVVLAVQGKLESSLSWLGDPRKERWEEDPKKSSLSPAQANSIISLCLNDLQQGNKVYPQGEPKGILFLGAALPRVRVRLAYLNNLYEMKKLSLSLPVYILTGERSLDEKIGETPKNLMDPDNGLIPFRKDWHPSNEHVLDEGEMIKLVFSQSRHSALEEKDIYFVYSPKGLERRATTESTVKQWLMDFSPASGRYVAISNQPYNFYQESVIRRVLLQSGRFDICVEVVGPGMDVNVGYDILSIEQAKNLLNNVSRILYELLEIKKNLKK